MFSFETISAIMQKKKTNKTDKTKERILPYLESSRALKIHFEIQFLIVFVSKMNDNSSKRRISCV